MDGLHSPQDTDFFPSPKVYEMLESCNMPWNHYLKRFSPGAVCFIYRTKFFSNPEWKLHAETLKSSLQGGLILAEEPSPGSFLKAHEISLSAPVPQSPTLTLFLFVSLHTWVQFATRKWLGHRNFMTLHWRYACFSILKMFSLKCPILDYHALSIGLTTKQLDNCESFQINKVHFICSVLLYWLKLFSILLIYTVLVCICHPLGLCFVFPCYI